MKVTDDAVEPKVMDNLSSEFVRISKELACGFIVRKHRHGRCKRRYIYLSECGRFLCYSRPTNATMYTGTDNLRPKFPERYINKISVGCVLFVEKGCGPNKKKRFKKNTSEELCFVIATTSHKLFYFETSSNFERNYIVALFRNYLAVLKMRSISRATIQAENKIKNKLSMTDKNLFPLAEEQAEDIKVERSAEEDKENNVQFIIKEQWDEKLCSSRLTTTRLKLRTSAMVVPDPINCASPSSLNSEDCELMSLEDGLEIPPPPPISPRATESEFCAPPLEDYIIPPPPLLPTNDNIVSPLTSPNKEKRVLPKFPDYLLREFFNEIPVNEKIEEPILTLVRKKATNKRNPVDELLKARIRARSGRKTRRHSRLIFASSA